MGVVRYVRLAERPEIAVTIVDGYQGHGVAPELLDCISEHAAEHGIHDLVATVLPENARAAKLVRRLGFVRDGSDGGLDVYRRPARDTRTGVADVAGNAAGTAS